MFDSPEQGLSRNSKMVPSTRLITQGSEHSIAQHHRQSVRFRDGLWMQWKNIPLERPLVQQFQKRLQ